MKKLDIITDRIRNIRHNRFLLGPALALLIFLTLAPARGARIPSGPTYVNSIGMKFVRIEPGAFQIGHQGPLPWEILPHTYGRGDRMDALLYGDYDERPVHTVNISKPFYMAVFEVTNSQYELFDPAHSIFRGKEGVSRGNDEAVVNVNWYKAQFFCRWLSEKEGLSYRLPTEAEWEYACRAGTTTNYYTGDVLPKVFVKTGRNISLKVGQTPANLWGLYDMHGNVEEWCLDWYGPYTPGEQTDPVGYADGLFRVSRGGSHGTQVYWFRSANRQGTLPQDKHWLIGFRLVIAESLNTKARPAPEPPLVRRNVVQRRREEVAKGPTPDRPYFDGPRRYVNIPRHMNGPIYAMHNHSPAIAACPNGDLIATWCTMISERNREPAVAASRLRRGAEKWDPACLFWKPPDRNSVGPSMWFDGDRTVYWFSGISIGDEYRQMAMVMRTSTDSGATWSEPELVCSDHAVGIGPGQSIFRLQDASIAASQDHKGGSILLLSADGCESWFNTDGIIRGIHACVAQMKDGRLLAFGRGGEIKGKMAQSISSDQGRTWQYSASEFPGIDGGQRSVMLRLKEGPLFFASFADRGIEITDESGQKRSVRGLFAAVSTDDGRSWPYKRLITDDGPGRPVECTNGGLFLMGQRTAEYQGYLAATQSLDGLIHLISSRQHYTFNLKWLQTPAPNVTAPQYRVQPVTETFDGPNDFDADGWVEYRSYTGGFNGKGQYTVKSLHRLNGLTRILSKGSFEATVAIKNISFDPGSGPITPGPRIRFRDPRQRNLSLRFDKDHIVLSTEGRKVTSSEKPDPVRYSTPPTSAKARLIWNEESRRWRIFYGLNGRDATTELPESKAGIYFTDPFSETTALYLVVDHGNADFDYLKIEPFEGSPQTRKMAFGGPE